jgi:hypothetical protein
VFAGGWGCLGSATGGAGAATGRSSPPHVASHREAARIEMWRGTREADNEEGNE